ncbi:hypothetical protein QP166_10070 [Sphingomonas sp. LR60]|uniref:hypothetical protein n=1 Tax=Sphingomonas sp. LR60 TaxID=3050233 RepID=UPI002FDF5FC6
MSRLMIGIRGFGFLLAVPLGLFMLWDTGSTLVAGAPSGWDDAAQVCCSCAALMLLNVAMVSTSATLGVVRLLIAHVVLAPLAAVCCYFGSVDPVALFVGLPLLAGVVVALGAASCPLRRRAASH